MTSRIKSLLLLAVAFVFFGETAKAQHYAVEATRMNEAFIGIPNQINVIVEGYSCKTILVTTDNGSLEKLGSCEYNFLPAETGRATIKILYKAGNKVIGERVLRVHHLPSPVARIGGKNSGRIPANVLRVQLGIATTLDGFDFDIKFNVTKYFLTVIGVGGQCSTFGPATTAFFTEPMKDALQGVKSGDRLIITGIRVLNYAKDELAVAPVDLTVE